MSEVFISDLDHTLLKNDLSISGFSTSIWNDFAKDSIMSIATARTYKKAIKFVDKLSLNAPLVLLDGALIATKDARIIDTKFIDKTLADEIVNEGFRFGIYPFILSLADKIDLKERFSYSTTLNFHQNEVLKNYKNDDHHDKQDRLIAHNDNFKIVYFGTKEQIEPLYIHLESIYKDNLKFIFAPEAYAKCYFLTILHKDATKAQGIKTISSHSGFSLNSLTAFGDNLNDIEMFTLAKTSVAVANAHEDVKQKATIVSSFTNDEDSVARYLKSLKND